jgi:serine/threonine protein kinase
MLANRYRLLQVLGQGGMSRVYLAEDARLGVRVAVKENLQTGAEARAQFRQEAQILARLSHPNLPRVMDHFVDAASGQQYLIMDYVEGEDLQSMIARRGPLPEHMALAWVRQILEALEYLHAQKPPVIHRDIKPGNIKITPQGRAVLVDFGIAKVYAAGTPTITGARAATPGYAPPEQYGMRTSERSDIYALGATLYTMLTGKCPPDAPLRIAGESTLVPPHSLGVAVSPNVEAVVLKAMELQSSRRYQSVTELRRMLEGRPASRARPSAKAEQPRQVLLYGGGALVLVIVLWGIVVMSHGSGRATPTPSSPPVVAMSTKTDVPTQVPAHPVATITAVPVPTTRPASPTATHRATETRTAPTRTPVPTSTLVPTVKPTPAGPPSCAIPVGDAFRNVWTNPSVFTILGCPINEQQSSSQSAEETFEHGLMLWRDNRGDLDNVYAFFDNGTFRSFSRRTDPWVEGVDPEYSCGTHSSPPSPRRGFSVVWCNHPDVRAQLGDAVDYELGFCMAGGLPCETFQDFAGGTMYLSTHEKRKGVLFVLHNDGIYDHW